MGEYFLRFPHVCVELQIHCKVYAVSSGSGAYLLIPTAASAIMGVAAFGVHKGMMLVLKSNAAATLAACMAAVVIYAVALLLLKGLSEEELLGFPKGRTLVSFAKKLHLM